MIIMISCGSFVMVFSKFFCCWPLLALLRQPGNVFALFWWSCAPGPAVLLGYFSYGWPAWFDLFWWSCSPGPTVVSVYFVHGWFVWYGWWLCSVSTFRLGTLIPYLRQSHDNHWHFTPVFLIFFYSSFTSLFGWTVVYFDCWRWYFGAMQHLWLFFTGGNMMHGCWQYVDPYGLVVACVLCLRVYYDNSYQCIFPSLLLPCFAFWLLHGYLGGLVPGVTALNGVAPSPGEQPAPRTPWCRPGWPSRSMMMPSFSETFVVIIANKFLYTLVKMSPFLRAFLHSRCFSTHIISTLFAVYLSPPFPALPFTALFLHLYWFLVTGSCFWMLIRWTKHSLCTQLVRLCPWSSWCVVHMCFGLPLFQLYITFFGLSAFLWEFPPCIISYCLLTRHSLFSCSMASEGAKPSKALFQTAFGLSCFCFYVCLSSCYGYAYSLKYGVRLIALDGQLFDLTFTLYYENY